MPEITSDWVEVPVSDGAAESTMPVYVAQPTTPGRYPNVVVGFEMFGVTGYVRSVTDRIAELGYRAVAPDFYHRLGDRIDLPATDEGRQRGLELLDGLDRDGVSHDMARTAASSAPP